MLCLAPTRHPRWLLASALVMMFALVPRPAAAQAGPTLTLSRGSGPVGTDVTVQGSGFPPLVAVALRLGRVDNQDFDCRDARATALLPTPFADERGDFSQTFMVPAQLAGPSGAEDTTPAPYCLLATSAPGLNVQARFWVTAVPPNPGASCSFVLGFATMHALLPDQVGACLEDEQHNPANGDGYQHTAGGLLVWRKADNWTAFTDGWRTWVDGPYGLLERLNRQHFPWEGPGSGAGTQLRAPAAEGQLVALYAVIDRGDYPTAYALWQDPPAPYAQFVDGYADTLQAAIRIGNPSPDDAAGNYGVAFPVVVLARHTDSSTVAFAGCYVLQAPKFQPSAAYPAGQPYRIVAAQLQPRPDIAGFADAAAKDALLAGCGT